MSDKLKKQILENLQNTYCRLKPSKTHGVGVFAIRDIPKNREIFSGVCRQRWCKFKMSELRRFAPEIKKMVDDFLVIEKDGTVYLPQYGLNGMDISFFLNGSDNPNLKVVYDKQQVTRFFTLKKIKKDEELFSSYADYDYKYDLKT